MTKGEELLLRLNAVLEQDQDEFRRHLGASTIGDKCMRQVWFKFRWTRKVHIEGRMLRLFNRGHVTEPRVVEWLKKLGCEVWAHDAEGKQFQIKEHGHYGGSCDGLLRRVPVLDPDEVCLLEIKTHNEKFFKKLVKGGVKEEFPKHYKQGQVYMRGLSAKWGIQIKKCLYVGVCKNDDHLYFEFFDADPTMGEHLSIRAKTVIYSNTLPPRISETPSWWECTFCDHKPICFEFETPHVNCRTCLYSKPEEDGTWSCDRRLPKITDDPESSDCDSHIFNPALFPSAHVEKFCFDENYIIYRTRKGAQVINGPNYTTSRCLDLR